MGGLLSGGINEERGPRYCTIGLNRLPDRVMGGILMDIVRATNPLRISITTTTAKRMLQHNDCSLESQEPAAEKVSAPQLWSRKRPVLSVVFSCLIVLGSLSVGPRTDPAYAGPEERPPIIVDVRENLERLLGEEDTDGDKKITIHDRSVQGSNRGDRRFWLIATDGKRYEVDGTYYLSNLLQELAFKQRAGLDVAPIDFEMVFEEPVHRISRRIRELYWESRTRRIDQGGIDRLLTDEKISTDNVHYLYVPHDDSEALGYYSALAKQHPELNLRVESLPATVTPHYVRGLEGKHGLLSLALDRAASGAYLGVPFIVPGGRFNEMYGWDSYFETLGLLEDHRVDLAKAQTENLVYEIAHYGQILNGNRTYYLTRSQPPFLTSIGLAVYNHLPKNEDTRLWLARVFGAAIKEYYTVWMSPPRLTDTGLSRYYGERIGPAPEVEEGHYDAIYRPYAEERKLDIRAFEERYKSGHFTIPALDQFFAQDRCMRESGHDTTYRWDWHGDRCVEFVTVDLNSLLYKTEADIARSIETIFGGVLTLEDGSKETSATWYARAAKRRQLIFQLLWDNEAGMFFDYDVVNKKRHAFVSATTLYPLWARLATVEQAEALVRNALPLLEMPGGLAGSSEKARGTISERRPARQWDYPYGWVPHQMLAWAGLSNYGHEGIAQRLRYRWLYTITRNAVDYNGTVPEKLDVVKRSHEVFAEYGNVGTEFEYIPLEGFGWMNASYQVGLAYLSPDLRVRLNSLIPPEWLFE
ncbi:MAG TPA: trehalase family glycosidase [Nitrospira sp.]|nr:trehalase family glycosidase [Nitrospira sp.]